MNRISQGVSRPGIDPRVWASMAFAIDEEFVDAEHGSFIDVRLLPNGEEITCYVPQGYVGKDFGEHDQLIHKDDKLLVVVTNGDPNEGGTVVIRYQNNVDKPPQLVVDHPADFVRVQETDTSYWLKLQGSGKWQTEAETTTFKTEKVRLGDESATEQVILGSTYRQKETTLHTNLITQLGVLAGLVTTAGASLTTAGPLTLLPPAGIAIAAAGAALTSAVASITSMAAEIGTFEASTAQYLSNVSKTK